MTYCQYVNYYHDYMHYLKYPFEKGMYVPFVSKVKYRHEFECADFNLPSDPTRRYIRPFDRMIPARNPDGSITHVKHYTVDYHLFEWNEVKMHHLSWIRADIRKKLENWSSKLIFENYNDLIDKSVCTFKRFDENSADTQKAVMMFFTPDNKVDIATFPKQFIHPRADINTRLRPAKDYKKLLVLSMSALKEPFISLDKVSKETWMNIDKEKYPNIDADFWVYTDAEDGHPTSIDREKHIIYIQQDHKHEDMVMSTYSKTIETLYLIKNELKLEYDYIVRTNNSTWLNIPLINEFLAYQHDDSMIFGGKLYSAFHSAFNVYAGGQLMIFSKRDIDILLKVNGSLESAKEYETKIVSADDNMLCGRLNERAIKLGLYYDDIYHSIGADDISGTEFDESDIDFFAAAYQVKTYDVSSDERIKYDSAKMRRIDELWREYDGTIDELYEGLMDNYYDAEIVVIPYSKKEWFGIEQKEVAKARLKCSKPRIEALKFLKEHQKKLGYYPANFI